MKITRDGETILNIQYDEREIRTHFHRETREMEFDCYFDGEYVGTTRTSQAAHAKLDALVLADLKAAVTN